MQCNAMKCNTMQYNTIHYNTIQCNAMQYNATQHNTIQHNTTQNSLSLERPMLRYGRIVGWCCWFSYNFWHQDIHTAQKKIIQYKIFHTIAIPYNCIEIFKLRKC